MGRTSAAPLVWRQVSNCRHVASEHFMSRVLKWITPVAALLAATISTYSARGQSFPGSRSSWHGFDRYDFVLDGKSVLVVVPRQPAPGRPWVWHGEFFGTPSEAEIA